MSFVENPLRLVVLVVMAAGLGWWVGAPMAIEPDNVKVATDNWQLTARPARNDGIPQVLAVGNAPYWGAQPAAAPAAVLAAGAGPDNRWRISGVVGRDANLRVLIAFAASTGKPPILLKAGDRLPSGHMIKNISEKSLCVEIGKKSYVLGLERVGTSP